MKLPINKRAIRANKWVQKIRQLLTFNASRYYLEQFVQEAAQSVTANSFVLDAGAGEGFYKHLFKHTHYESTDFYQVDKLYGHVNFVSNLAHIPVVDQRYDLVLLTQVIEHLPEPLLVLQEIQRILKNDGTLWISGPLFFPEHEKPYDFYRYTQFGFKHLLEKAGFTLINIQPLEGYSTTLSFQLKFASMQLPFSPSAYGGGLYGLLTAFLVNIVKPVFFALSLLLDFADRKHKIVNAGMCKNYCAVAVKRA